VTAYYIVEEEDSFHADDFGNDDVVAKVPLAPTGLAVIISS
jgi:hypothetical protein